MASTRAISPDLANHEFVAVVCRLSKSATSSVQELLIVGQREPSMMSLVRLLGFNTLGCGCVTGHYREVATSREVTYIEEKGTACEHPAHRRNHTLSAARMALSAVTAKAS
jgi:hypothetical protein